MTICSLLRELLVVCPNAEKIQTLAFEIYGRDDDEVAYNKTGDQWAFGKIMAYRILKLKNGCSKKQFHLW